MGACPHPQGAARPPIPRLWDDAPERLRAVLPWLWLYGLLIVAAYGAQMTHVILTGDDWEAVNTNQYQYDWLVSIGRWLSVLVYRASEDDRFAPSFTVMVLAGGYLVAALGLALCLGLRSVAAMLVLAGMLVTFPFNVEPFAFKLQHLNFALGLVLSTVAGLTAILAHEAWEDAKGPRAGLLLLGSGTAFALAASVYQPMFLFGCAAVMVRLLALVDLSGKAAQARRWGIGVVACGLTAAAGGLLLYAVLVGLSSRLTGVPLMADGPYAVVNALVGTWQELWGGLTFGGMVLGALLVDHLHLFPQVLKGGFYLVAAMVGLCYVRRTGAKPWFLRLAVFALVLAGLMIAPMLLGMVTKLPYYRPNNLAALAIPYAVMFALLVEYAQGTRWRPYVQGLAVVAVGMCAFQQSRASAGAMLQNQRDLAVVNRMLERIAADAQFDRFLTGQPINIFIAEPENWRPWSGWGGRPFMVDDLPPVRGHWNGHSTLECGLFNCRPALMNEAFHLVGEGNVTYKIARWPYVPPTVSAEEKQVLQQKIAAAHPWPSPLSVIYGPTSIVVVF